MYEAAEDSELIATVVKQYAVGKTLDLGTGSGVLAATAAEKGCLVLAVDIDKEALSTLRDAPFKIRYSDQFSAVRGKFETIICNPPYLPNDKTVHDATLHGGKKGYEYIIAIIKQAKNYLQPKGQFLFLISTLTKPVVVEKALLEEGYSWTIVARKKLFMEELFVYRATLAIDRPCVLLGKGKRSLVYGFGSTAVKVSTPLRASKEAQLLKHVNKKGIGPRYIKHEENRLFMQRISGEPLNKYIEKKKDIPVLKAFLRQTRVLDALAIKKQELSRPGTNVLITSKKKVVLLDFERSIFTQRPNNVTQAATYIGRVLHKDVGVALQHYKHSYTAADYKKIEAGLFNCTRPHRR